MKGTARCIPCDPRDFRVWRSCGRAGIVWATARSRRRQSSRNGLDHRLRRPGRDQYAMAPLSPAEAAVTCEASRTDGSAFTRSGTTVMASADPQLRISPTVSSAACRNWLPVAEILGDPVARRRSFGLLRHHRQRARGGATIYIGGPLDLTGRENHATHHVVDLKGRAGLEKYSLVRGLRLQPIPRESTL